MKSLILSRTARRALIGVGAAALVLLGVEAGVSFSHGPGVVLFRPSDVATPARTEQPSPDPANEATSPPPALVPTVPVEVHASPNPNGVNPPKPPKPVEVHPSPNFPPGG